MQRIAGVHPKAKNDGHGCRHEKLNERWKVKQNESFSAAVRDLVELRNLRSYWVINTEATPEAHFATFPIRLAERCILLGCPEGGTVLDPFAGAGTAWLACLKHGRRFQGIELNPVYVQIAEQRARRLYPLLVAASAPMPDVRKHSQAPAIAADSESLPMVLDGDLSTPA